MSSKTYVVGNGATVKRLDNVDAGPPYNTWTNYTLPFTTPVGVTFMLYDVKTDPTNSNKVFVAGRITGGANPFHGLAFSTDGGVTWISPLGTYITGIVSQTYFKIWCVDSNIIYACGNNGMVVKSVDGGYTFNQVGALPFVTNVYSIHFINNQVGVIGVDGYVLKSINGGTSWTTQNNGNAIPGIGQVRGIYYDGVNNLIACGQNTIQGSSNGGITFFTRFTWTPNSGNSLSWYGLGATIKFWASGNKQQIITSSDLGVTWTDVEPYTPMGIYDYSSVHFYSATNGFYGLIGLTNLYGVQYKEGIFPPTSSLPGFNVLDLKRVNAVWTTVIPPQCYRLTNCLTNIVYTTSTDLFDYIGQVVNFSIITGNRPNQISTLVEGCWTVSVSPNCLQTVVVSINSTHADCGACITGCYQLINCQDNDDIIITTDSIWGDYLNEYVKFESCPEKCYFVTLTTNCDNPVDTRGLVVMAVENSCLTCLNQTIVPNPVELQLRSITPGYYTPGCPPAYTEKVNCSFANAVWDEMVKSRYGVYVCCDENMDKWDIKKQLLDLNAIYNPDLCVSAVIPCLEPCNIAASLFVPAATVGCAAPTDAEGVVTIDPDPCPSPAPSPIIITFGYGTPP